MCRLFGFRSVIQSQVHSSLLEADNALGLQSNEHPDGWGVAYYLLNSPHLIKSSKSALKDSLFKKVSGVVSSETVLAHIRKTTIGDNNILNTHPFQFGKWVFAHNGNISNFNEVKNDILARINPSFRRFILGETDSELIFYFILSHLHSELDLSDKMLPIHDLFDGLKDCLKELKKVAGSPAEKDNSGEDATYYTFLLTNGKAMVGYHGGKNLYYSTYKNKCHERETCPSFSAECESATQTGYINHLIFSSEPLSGENIWIPLQKDQLVGVDTHMKLTIS